MLMSLPSRQTGKVHVLNLNLPEHMIGSELRLRWSGGRGWPLEPIINE
jgi:hypothetical protein|eukprot:COSAG02_NODE_972_length_15544_cov_3.570735_10_plen_48_part_00